MMASRAISCIAILLHFICWFVCSTQISHLDDIDHHLKEFRNSLRIKPRIHHGRETGQMSTKHAVKLNNLIVEIDADNQTYVLELRLNHDLIPKNYFRKYQKNGEFVFDEAASSGLNLCQYKGSVVNRTNSWAAISSCDGVHLNGAFYDGSSHVFYLENFDLRSDNDGEHFLFKDTDFVHIHQINSRDHISNSIHILTKRSTDRIKSAYKATDKSRYIELLLVLDYSEYRVLKSLEKAYQRSKDIANILNALFSQLNIFVCLTGVIVWTERDEIIVSKNGDDTLANFLVYRQRKLNIEHPNDNAQLLTKVVFDNGVVGKAIKGPICTSNSSGGIAMDHSSVLGLVATTIAHELGHNFGMEHDTGQCHCVDETGCIMAPSSTSVIPKHWSSCSLDYLALAFTHGMDYCLRNKPVSLFASPTCRNGFLESGEECDCGLPEFCNNTCCDAATCKLHSNVTCGTGDCCDLTTCEYKKGGTECRRVKNECDLPEYCTGDSEFCSDDVFKMNSAVCDNGLAYCYEGSCKTRSDQCKILWGETGYSNDECYERNTEGTRHGNCGYNHYTKVYKKCENSDVNCGMLHCYHLNERLEFGIESSAIISKRFINYRGSIIACRNALVDLGLDSVDPGLVPNGAKCSDNEMCFNQRCFSIDYLRNTTFKMCDNNCSGNGVCNSQGNCHCNEGFGPPDCSYSGYGGSIDSGPMVDPKGRNVFMFLIYVLFFGIFPTFGVLAFLFYYGQYNFGLKIKKPNFMSANILKPRPMNTHHPSHHNDRQLPPVESDNSTLLQHETKTGLTNQFFGHFKGFSISPIKKSETPQSPVKIVQRLAPPAPVPRFPTEIKQHINVFENTDQSHGANDNELDTDVKSKQTSTEKRPEISNPILHSTTNKDAFDSVKEKPLPMRPAPSVPSIYPNKKNDSLKSNTSVPVTKKITAINRIASFLKSTNNHHQQHEHVVVPIKKPICLKNIEISEPIPLNEIIVAKNAVPVQEMCSDKTVVMRSHSFRNPASVAAAHRNTQNFGSLRRSHSKRPTSVPFAANRPKNPPPPKPPCIDNNSDNIYAVIEDVKTSSSSQPKISEEEPPSNDSLLGEILNEIQNRNTDSIYSASTLMRNKSENRQNSTPNQLYVNMAEVNEPPTNIYVNLSEIKDVPDIVVSCQTEKIENNQPDSFSASKRVNNLVQKMQKKFES